MNRKIFLEKLRKYGEKEKIPNISAQNETFLRNLISENACSSILEI